MRLLVQGLLPATWKSQICGYWSKGDRTVGESSSIESWKPRTVRLTDSSCGTARVLASTCFLAAVRLLWQLVFLGLRRDLP